MAIVYKSIGSRGRWYLSQLSKRTSPDRLISLTLFCRCLLFTTVISNIHHLTISLVWQIHYLLITEVGKNILFQHQATFPAMTSIPFSALMSGLTDGLESDASGHESVLEVGKARESSFTIKAAAQGRIRTLYRLPAHSLMALKCPHYLSAFGNSACNQCLYVPVFFSNWLVAVIGCSAFP